MDWGWDYSTFEPFDWRAAVYNLPEEKRDEMLGSSHVCRCTLEPLAHSYDRKRRDHMQKCSRRQAYPEHVPVPMWDWHILLSNGQVWRFHTDYNARKASHKQVLPGDMMPPPPKAGKNKSDGPGSYNGFKIGNYAHDMHRQMPAESAVAEEDNGGGQRGCCVVVP